MSDSKQFIHIGYGKAGSTALQNNYFANCKDIHFLGISFDETPDGNLIGKWLNHSVQNLVLNILHPEYFDGFSQEEIDDLENQKRIAAESKRPLVLSNDHLSLVVAPQWSVQKLKDLFPKGQIIITVRRQQDLIKSLYMYRGCCLFHAPRKQRFSFVSFNDWFDYIYRNFNNRGGHKARDWEADCLRIFDFRRLIRNYADVFGHNNVHIFIYEELRAHPKRFYKRLSDILGIEYHLEEVGNKIINKSPPALNIKYMAIKSKLFGNFLFSGHVPGAKAVSTFIRKTLIRFDNNRAIALTADQEKTLQELYGKGNSEISTEYNLGLDQYNYYM